MFDYTIPKLINWISWAQGDGKIFVLPIEGSVWVSTREEGERKETWFVVSTLVLNLRTRIPYYKLWLSQGTSY